MVVDLTFICGSPFIILVSVIASHYVGICCINLNYFRPHSPFYPFLLSAGGKLLFEYSFFSFPSLVSFSRLSNNLGLEFLVSHLHVLSF
jgi:hypothetical protein